MTAEIIVSIVVAVAFAVGLVGIVVPIIPGSITIVVATLIWAIVLGSWSAWVAFGIILLFSAAGMTCSYVLTGRRLREHQVPYWPIIVGIICGIVGIFVIPFLGLFIGFLIGLYVSEWSRRGDMKLAWESSWVAMKALGIGLILELGFGFLSTLTFAVALTTHFVLA
ncbi:MAG: DUF456 domain-containing protein [Brachybacterium sp.]|nr:DUF456 domain-containing protein [Brachybacterium sp.]